MLNCCFCAGNANIESYEVDEDRVRREKAAVLIRTGNDSNGNFVSTNDILVSSFGKAVRSRILLMPVN